MPVRKNIRHPQPSNEETTLSGIAGAFADVVHTHIAADTTDFATAVGLLSSPLGHDHDADYVDIAGDTMTGSLEIEDNLVLPKTSGKGIQVDTTTPTFGWRDILGTINTRGLGATDPDWGAIAGGVMSAYKFSLNDVCWISYHIPHDYVPGTSWHSHVHWLPDGTNTAAVKWQMEWMYAKGHNQGAFNVGSITTTSASDTPGGTAYQHYVTESTANSSTNIEPDGIIYMKISRVTNGGTDNTDDIFVLQCDLHYQSTNIGTKAKAYPFYT